MWDELSALVGGNLLNDPGKLHVIHELNHRYRDDISWEEFCSAVILRIRGEMIESPICPHSETDRLSPRYGSARKR